MDGFKNSTKTHYMKGGMCEGYAKGGKVSGAAKIAKVMGEFKSGKLHSGSKKGPEVTNPKQAVAIAISEARKSGARVPVKKKGGGRIDRNMIESTSARPTGTDIAPVDRLEGNETPRSVTVERRSVTVEPSKRYRGREGDIPVGRRTDPNTSVMPSDLDRTLRTLPSERGEMRRGPAGAGFSVRPLVEMARDALGFKNGGLSKMPRGKKC